MSLSGKSEIRSRRRRYYSSINYEKYRIPWLIMIIVFGGAILFFTVQRAAPITPVNAGEVSESMVQCGHEPLSALDDWNNKVASLKDCVKYEERDCRFIFLELDGEGINRTDSSTELYNLLVRDVEHFCGEKGEYKFDKDKKSNYVKLNVTGNERQALVYKVGNTVVAVYSESEKALGEAKEVLAKIGY